MTTKNTNSIYNSFSQDILDGNRIDIEGITYGEYKILCQYAKDNNTCLNLYYAMSEFYDDEEVLSCQGVVNPENSQRTMYMYIDKDDAEYEDAKRELIMTGQYHDWTSLASRLCKRIYSVSEDGYDEYDPLSELDIEKYNNYVNSYNKYGDAVSLSGDMTGEEQYNVICENQQYL